MDTSFRPMSKRERAELEGIVSVGTQLLRAVLFSIAVALVGWLSFGVQSLANEVRGVPFGIPVWIVPSALFAAILYRRSARWTGGRAFRFQVRADLRGGVLAKHHVVVAEAVETPEIEDEGPVFFLEDQDGRTLFFAGQSMAREKQKGFPWREFEIVEAPESRYYFGVRRLGEPFADVTIAEPLSAERAQALGVWSANYGFVDSDLGELFGPGG